ncbi:hypothetical protein SVIO_092160 [Streptomyces violaceusniger]|uniref:Uncharacterized protein n=1 Tax=Streptomyces violaceusniger TaxID=68280 RepID=A0A4D4LKJ6_STRVO|nr:hypothetical protein SVIO_092160 [Streptomyces violaceusniger]
MGGNVGPTGAIAPDPAGKRLFRHRTDPIQPTRRRRTRGPGNESGDPTRGFTPDFTRGSAPGRPFAGPVRHVR